MIFPHQLYIFKMGLCIEIVRILSSSDYCITLLLRLYWFENGTHWATQFGQISCFILKLYTAIFNENNSFLIIDTKHVLRRRDSKQKHCRNCIADLGILNYLSPILIYTFGILRNQYSISLVSLWILDGRPVRS